jgi:gliding motility-associated-like protein
MMKSHIQLFVALWGAFFFCQTMLFAQPNQPISIDGPSTLCIGECGTYQIVYSDSSLTTQQVVWGTSNGNILSDNEILEYCATDPVQGNTVVLVVLVSSSSGAGQTLEFPITITAGLTPTIRPTIASCPVDSNSNPDACEKICAFGTAQYEVFGVPTGTPVTWSVQGAESFTPNGNTVTVEWGAPGQGQVSVVAGNTSAALPFQLFCGQQNIGVNTNATNIYLFGLDGTPPYTVEYSINGNSQVIFSVSLPTTIPAPQPGVYDFTVTDATGQTDHCSTNVVASSQECWFSVYPTFIIQPTEPNACNGSIQLTTNGGVPPYSYQWSNGAASPAINQACCGTYFVTVTDGNDCTATIEVALGCQTPTCSGEASICVEILEEPEALIGSLPPPQPNGTIAICQGQTVYFQNNSTNATSYVWELLPGVTSTQFEPSQTYNTPGSYIVSLIARNECFCADTTTVEVYVLAAEVPEILCTGTICEGETVTYSTDASCSGYTWALTGSYAILDGGGPTDNFITVEWLAGPEGIISLTTSGCAGVTCPLPNVVPIPIVSDNVEIQGPNKVCEGSTEEYYIPDYQGTTINWTVLGSGNIVDGQGTERITVNWYGAANLGNPQRVIVEFDNCYLGCSGRDTLNVNIVPGFYMTGPIEVCASTSGSYQTRNTITDALIPANWELINSSGTVVWSSPTATNTANIPFNFPAGNYTVHAEAASASSFCTDGYDIFIELRAAPPAPTAIVGENEICPGTAYAYEATGLPTTDFTWTFTGGTPANFGGNPATVVWNATGPYSISVTQTATTGLACTSPPATLAVVPIPAFSITGDAQVCREQRGTYTVPFFENIDYQWVVSPATAGTVISGQGAEQVEVLWHTDGPATVSVTVCGATQTYNVTVLPLPEPFVPNVVACIGQTTSVSTSVAYASYIWKDNAGATVSNLASPALGPGYYEVEVTDANGCMGDTIFTVGVNPAPNVSISTPSYPALCPGGPGATLYATESSPPYSYQWQFNGTNVGANSPSFNGTQPGDYQVIATAVNGCTAVSNIITLVDCAAVGGTCVGGVCTGFGGGPPVPGAGCTPAGNVDFSFTTTSDCYALSFTNASTNFVPGSFTWYFGDGTTSTADNPPPHVYPGMGYYTVLLVGAVNSSPPGSSCVDWVFYDVLIPVAADFEVANACPNSPAQFTDHSVFISPASITDWAWDFGDPASGAANTSTLQNPTHNFATAGNYTVTLTITESSGCTVITTRQVTVLALPAVSFSLPAATCENTSLPFDATIGANVASVYWNFGDPTSGDGNNSELANAYHEFDAPGSYAVQLTALSIEGCTNVFTDNMTITPNTLSGVIAAAPPSPLCEGESTTLTAPAGGVSWLWSNNSTINNITISESGVYIVTLTDATGCTYSPPPATVDVFGEPNGIIKGVEYNEFGQPVAFFENSQSVCAGEAVNLIVQGSLNNSYAWSGGETGNALEFSEDKGNLLPVGTHVFNVTVTDATTGCTATEGPFTVTVNPLPTVAISSSPAGFICENTNATLSVASPVGTNTYQWNTGETGTSIAVFAGGIYFATAINQFGCSAQSNEITIQNAPDVDLVPAGCHTRCQPDTMCLPTVPNIASYQWLFNGSPMAGPNGTSSDPIFTQSGEYAVVMTDVYGCTSTSAVLTLDLFPGFGDILGEVYFDVNQNGVIDGPDTLVSGINIFLNNGTANIDTVTSTTSAGYNFVDILSTDYDLYLDSLNLPAGWTAVWSSSSITLSGCDVEEQFDWLLTSNCAATTGTATLAACSGESATYAGTPVPAGTSMDFTLTNFQGCDSIVTVTVLELATSTGSETLTACPGTSALYNGTPVMAGTSQPFTLTNYLGCDSIVTVTVNPLPAPGSSIALTACPGDFADYNGTPLPPGTDTLFLYPSAQSCDSVVNVTVTPLAISTSTVNLSACTGETASYNGANILAGTSQPFTFTNWLGCDSVVTVVVAELTASTGAESLNACPGTSATYAGTPVPAGTSMDFTLTSWLNCDSVVTVSVATLPAGLMTIDAIACMGEFYDYNGNQIAAGDSQVFYETNQWGCQDTVIVGVMAVPTSASSLQLVACPGETATYNGIPIPSGMSMDFPFTNWLNCDSIVTVTVVAGQTDTVQLAFQVCEGETVLYNGQELAANETYDWIGTNQAGCDSVVQVSVTAFPSVSYDLFASQICWNALNGSIAVGNIQGSTPPYQFSLNGTVFQADTLFVGLPPGEYSVLLQDQNNCVFEETTTIGAIPPITVEAEDKTLVCGGTVVLNPLVSSELPLTWQWADSTGVISTEAEITVSIPGTYVFSVSNNCEAVNGQVQVSAEGLSVNRLIYLPNSFSPNGDGINDCYQGFVKPDLDVLSYELMIFDRWGEQLFETTDINGCWDGKLRDKDMNPSVMVYWMTLEARNCDGKVERIFRKGDISLVR